MTNTWASSPPPPLDALSSESSSSSSVLLVGWHIASTLLSRLWDAYVAYLWCYHPNSWVSRVASTFRILAVVLVLPVVLLTLLDVTSYVIARTLGVVDDVKAATSDVDTTADGGRVSVAAVSARVPTTCACPSAALSHASARASESLAPEDSIGRRVDGDELGHGVGRGHGCVSETGVGTSVAVHARGPSPLQVQARTQTQVRVRAGASDEEASDASPQAYYFLGEDDLRLAGEGVFSPAASMPPSPLTPCLPLYTFTEGDGRGSGQVSEEEGIILRRRTQGTREDKLGHT